MGRLRFALLLTTTAMLGCRGGPTIEDARDYLHEGDPESALEAARGAAGRAPLAKERVALRRVAFRASLSAGWSHEAASEYLELRRLTGHEDPALLAELSRATLGMALRGPDGGRRLRALATLSDLSDLERARARAMAALSEQRPELRAGATWVVARLPNLEDALSGLEKAARDPAPRVRGAALESLRGPFSARLLPEERGTVLGRLTQIALAGATDPSAQVRLAAVDLLGALAEDPRAQAGLVAAVGNGSDSVCLRAAQRLLAIDPALALSAWTRAKPTGPTLGAFGRGLALHVGKGSHAAVARDLRSASYRLRLAAVQSLAGPAASRLAPQLAALLQRDPATSIRLAALRALLAGGGEATDDALRLALRQDDAATRRLAFVASEQRGGFSLDELGVAFRDPATALDAARTLVSAHNGQGLDVVRAGLGQVATRLVSAEALGELGEPALRTLYIELLEDPDPKMRRHGARGLVAAGLPEDRILLVQAMLEPAYDADVVAAAALLAVQARTESGASTGLSVH